MSVAPSQTKSHERKTGFDVLFVGLICFLKRERLALLPDGRTPRDTEVAPHFPYIVVDRRRITSASGWEVETDALVLAFMKNGVYRLPKCRLEITKATAAGTLDASHHDQYVPKLRDSDPNAVVNSGKANAVVRCKVGTGKLEAFRLPDAEPDEDDAAIIARLRVSDHDQPITIEVFEKGKKDPRTLVLEPHTDIALANIALPDAPGKTGDHFSIFGELTESRTIGKPKRVSARVDRLEQPHPIFNLGIPVQDGQTPCGTQGCCPP